MFRTLVLTAMLATLMAATAAAAEPQVTPAKGQTQAQQERDQYECHEWATQETGVDPVALAEQKLATPSPPGHGSGAGSGARSAGIGALRGAADGDAAAGAARGFGIGRLIAMAKARKQLKEQQSAGATDGGASVQAQLARYDQAYATCLSARGYTVQGK